MNPADQYSYPQFFSEIESLAEEKGAMFPTLKFSCGTRGRAIHLRQRFYGWRVLRFRAGASRQLAAISVGVEGDTITFTHVDEAFGLSHQLADQLRELGVRREYAKPSPGLEALITPAAEGGAVATPAETQSTPSEQEAVLRKLGLIP